MQTISFKINDDQTKIWYLDEEIHREDGPAIEYVDGSKEWLFNGKLHRIGGPAIEYANGRKVWIISINKSYNLFYGLINNIENLLDYFIGEE